MSKHYIRLNENNLIIKGFSDDFEQPLDTDICINENGGRHFAFVLSDGSEGEINPSLINEFGSYIYKFEDGIVMHLTDTEIKLTKEYKNMILRELNNFCQIKILGAFESSALGTPHLYSYDAEAQRNFTIAEQVLKYYPDDRTVDWRIHDTREIIPHTKAQLIQVFLDAVKHLQDNIARYRELETQVIESTVPVDINDMLNKW